MNYSERNAKRMHYAKVENSPRLQRVRDVLFDGQEHSTRDIMEKAHVCAVNSCITELRRNGFQIPKPRIEGNVFYYKMLITPEQAPEHPEPLQTASV